MRIDSSGNVGIGTTSPNRLLDISGAGAEVEIESTNTEGAELVLNNSAATVPGVWSIKNRDNGRFSIIRNQSDSLERLTILESGNVGIGTTAPGAKLHVNGTAADAGIETRTQNTDSTGFERFFLYNDLGTIGGIQGIGSAYSTAKIRNDIEVASTSNGADINMVLDNSGTTFNVMGPSRVELMTINSSSGNVGIGTTSPNEKLEVKGALRVTSALSTATDGSWGAIDFAGSATNETRLLSFGDANTVGKFRFYQAKSGNAGAITSMVIDSSGNVNITTGNFDFDTTGAAIRFKAAGSQAGSPAANKVALYVDESTNRVGGAGADCALVARLNDNTEINVATLVTDGGCP